MDRDGLQAVTHTLFNVRLWLASLGMALLLPLQGGEADGQMNGLL